MQTQCCHSSTTGVYTRGVTKDSVFVPNVFVRNRHGTGTFGWLQRWTAVRKCCIHSVNMANVKACIAMQTLKLGSQNPPPDRVAQVYYSDSVTNGDPSSIPSSPSGCRIRNAIRRTTDFICWQQTM